MHLISENNTEVSRFIDRTTRIQKIGWLDLYLVIAQRCTKCEVGANVFLDRLSCIVPRNFWNRSLNLLLIPCIAQHKRDRLAPCQKSHTLGEPAPGCDGHLSCQASLQSNRGFVMNDVWQAASFRPFSFPLQCKNHQVQHGLGSKSSRICDLTCGELEVPWSARTCGEICMLHMQNKLQHHRNLGSSMIKLFSDYGIGIVPRGPNSIFSSTSRANASPQSKICWDRAMMLP